jgi:hypothetical protein
MPIAADLAAAGAALVGARLIARAVVHATKGTARALRGAGYRTSGGCIERRAAAYSHLAGQGDDDHRHRISEDGRR